MMRYLSDGSRRDPSLLDFFRGVLRLPHSPWLMRAFIRFVVQSDNLKTAGHVSLSLSALPPKKPQG